MDTNNDLYEIEKVKCKNDSCKKEFSVVVSPIYTVVTRPTQQFRVALERVEVADEGLINDYIVVKCPCGTIQRVYLKIKNHE